jgi:hypothetical protein
VPKRSSGKAVAAVIREIHVLVIDFRRGFVSMLHSVCHWSGVDSLNGPDENPDPCFETRRISQATSPVQADRLVSRFLLLYAVVF